MYKLIRTETELSDAISTLQPDSPVFADTETCQEYGKTTGGLYGSVRLIQIYQSGDKNAFIIDCFFIDLQTVLNVLQPFNLVFHNASYDLHTINCHTKELWLPEDVDDSMYASKLLFFTELKFDFYSCLKYAGVSDSTIESINKKEQQKTDWSKDLTGPMLDYAAYDVLYLSLLWDHCKVVQDTQAYTLDIINLKHAIKYDRHGLPMNRASVRKAKQETILRLEKYRPRLPCNPNSFKKCADWLGIPKTDATALGILALEGDSRAEDLMAVRTQLKRLQFIEKYSGSVTRGFHNVAGARTGRFSCTGGNRYFYDNTQNPPRYLHPCIEAPEGKALVYKDYSGLELRMAVAIVGDPVMTQMLVDGEDMHTYTGCHLFGKTPETLSKEKRTITKFYNFGTIYGAYPKTLRSLLRSEGRIDLSLQEVTRLRSKWLDLYHYFKEWHSMVGHQFSIYGYMDIYTLLGRRIRAYSVNDALNFGIQGSSSEVTKVAVKLLFERYSKYEPYIINVVHDSIAIMQDDTEAEVWVARLNECMLDAWYYVIENSSVPDLPMPAEAQSNSKWEWK